MYEYLPKMHALLGGRTEQYREMYEWAIDVATKHLLARPMLPDEKDILISGEFHVPPPVSNPAVNSNPSNQPTLKPEGSHLTCFVGGMYALGAKLFDRKDDLTIAEKLTEGCVWAYDVTATGIMPEIFDVVPCDTIEGCKYNKTAYYDQIDPHEAMRRHAYEQQMKVWEKQVESAALARAVAAAGHNALATSIPVNEVAIATAPASPQVLDPAAAAPVSDLNAVQQELEKRQLVLPETESVIGTPPPDDEDEETFFETSTPTLPYTVGDAPVQQLNKPPPIPTEEELERLRPVKPLPHEEYAEQLIKQGAIPPGMLHIRDRRYILR